MSRKNRLFAKLANTVNSNGRLQESSLAADIELGGGGVTTYEADANLPSSGNSVGDLGYIEASSKLFLWNGATWRHILTAEVPNSAPFFTSNQRGILSLAKDGTTTNIDLDATDPEGTTITWNYTVTAGTLGNTATITNNGNGQFAITPSTDPANAGEFGLTFTASDGVNVTNSNQLTFTLYFNLNWGAVNNSVSPTGVITRDFLEVDGDPIPNNYFPAQVKVQSNEVAVIISNTTSGSIYDELVIVDISDHSNPNITFREKNPSASEDLTFVGYKQLLFNDEWIVIRTDYANTAVHSCLVFYKKTNNTWSRHSVISTYNDGGGGPTSYMDWDIENKRLMVIPSNTANSKILFYHYNSSTDAWELNSTINESNWGQTTFMMYCSIRGQYAVATTGTAGYLKLFYYNSVDDVWTWQSEIQDTGWDPTRPYIFYTNTGRVIVMAQSASNYIEAIEIDTGSHSFTAIGGGSDIASASALYSTSTARDTKGLYIGHHDIYDDGDYAYGFWTRTSSMALATASTFVQFQPNTPANKYLSRVNPANTQVCFPSISDIELGSGDKFSTISVCPSSGNMVVGSYEWNSYGKVWLFRATG